jgi:glutamate-1-semialdehyde 2,1-aminomutase
MSAGLRALELLTPDAYARLESQGDRLRHGLRDAARHAGLPAQVYGVASLTGLALCAAPFDSFRDMVSACGPGHKDRLLTFHREMLNSGVLLAPGGVFVGSTPMTDADIDFTVAAAARAFDVLARIPGEA